MTWKHSLVTYNYRKKTSPLFFYKMEEIEIKIDKSVSEDSEESSDISRDQEKWTERLDDFIEDLASQCKESFRLHSNSHAKMEFRGLMLNGVTLIIPLLSAGINELPYISGGFRSIPSLLMVISAGVVSVKNMLKYEKRAQQHFEFASKYRILENRIQYTLSRSKKNRLPADVRVQEFINERNVLLASAP